jgi:hypothetical protein
MPAFFGAGILFVSENCNSVLSGFHPKLNRWSGFGGKCYNEESPLVTAVREVIEEIFGIFDVSHGCLLELICCIHSLPNNNSGYVLYIESETKLFQMVDILVKNNYISPYYLTLPKNAFELNHFRQSKEEMEITRIESFYIIDLQDKKGLLTNEFYNDIQKYVMFPRHYEFVTDSAMLKNILEELGDDSI